MTFTGLLIFFSVIALSKAESLCGSYTQCREQLLTRRWLCSEKARKATEHPCRLSDDLKILWKDALWREKVLSYCLANEDKSTPDSADCPPEISSLILDTPLESPLECGLAMSLHEERCERLKNCCPEEKKCFSEISELPGAKQLERRRRLTSSRAASCRRRMFAAIYANMTREDISIAKHVAEHSGKVLDLLASLRLNPGKVKTSSTTSLRPEIPNFFKINKKKAFKTPPKTAGVPSKPLKSVGLISVDNDAALKLQGFGRHHQRNALNNVEERPAIVRRPWSSQKLNSTGKPRKVKTLFSKFFSSKTRSSSKPWIPPIVQSLPGLVAVKQNTSRSVGRSFPSWSEQNVVREEINRLKNRRIVETTKKPIPHEFMKQVEPVRLVLPLSAAEKSASEEDFDREFEKKAGSLVSFGPNALPLPGTKQFVKSARVEDPLIDVAEKSELRPADVSDIVRTTRAPVMRPRLRPTTTSSPPIQTLAPVPLFSTIPPFPPPSPIWNPLLAFFSTPAPLVWSTVHPIQLWPFKKRRRKYKAAKTFNGDESSPEIARKIHSIPKEEPKELNACQKLKKCYSSLEQKEKECKVSLSIKGISRKKSSFCENLKVKMKIEELFKSLEVDFRQCVMKSNAIDEHNHNCAVAPDLPEEVYASPECNKNIALLRDHCSQLANCCSMAASCRSSVDSSPAAADLRLRQRRLAMLATDCENKTSIRGSYKTKKKKKVPRIEGDANLETLIKH